MIGANGVWVHLFGQSIVALYLLLQVDEAFMSPYTVLHRD